MGFLAKEVSQDIRIETPGNMLQKAFFHFLQDMFTRFFIRCEK